MQLPTTNGLDMQFIEKHIQSLGEVCWYVLENEHLLTAHHCHPFVWVVGGDLTCDLDANRTTANDCDIFALLDLIIVAANKKYS